MMHGAPRSLEKRLERRPRTPSDGPATASRRRGIRAKQLRRWLGVLTLCVGTGLGAVRPASAQSDDALATQSLELNLSVGENKTLSAKGIKSYSEGSPGVVEVRLTPEGNEFVVVGQKPGSTTLLMISGNRQQLLYSINVFARSMIAVEHELRLLLTGNTGIRIRRVGPRLFIEGGVNNEQELERIKHIAGLYPGQVESLVVVGGVAADRKHNIQLDVYYVQFEKSHGHQVGLSWPSRVGPLQASVSYDLVAGRYSSGTASVVNQALLGLDMASARGWAKVLKHSTVITANGSKANFNSGGEQNYEVISNQTAGLQALKFGTDVEVLPRFDPGTGDLEIKVDAQISELTAPVSATASLPGRNTSTLGTLVNLKLGQALILSGIETKTQRRSVSGVPLLSDIPILGVLFGSHRNEEQEIEGAILLIPTVLEAIPKRNEALLKELMEAYDDYPADQPLRPIRRAWKESDEVLPSDAARGPAALPNTAAPVRDLRRETVKAR